jgi:hypothetical protein
MFFQFTTIPSPLTLPSSTPGPMLDLLGQAQQQGLAYSQANGFGVFLSRIFRILMVVGLLSVLIFFLWGAFDWISAGGEKGKIDSARNKITGAIIGLIVLAATVALFALMQKFLGVQILIFS